ncbi:hypothetical protein HN747_04330 [archaeon]|jgi:hypothetical protein|nr:hypothetical protein [archaeon]
MKIALLKHLSNLGYESLLDSANRCICVDSPDLIIGPDYGLSLPMLETHQKNSRQDVLGSVQELSRAHPSVRLILGSMSWQDGDKMLHSSPSYTGGELQNEFFKKRSNGEADMARASGLQFVGGDSSLNQFNFGNKRFSYEICGDHGHQDVSGVDVELISAYDTNFGFYVNATNDHWDRIVLGTDGLSGRLLAQKFEVGNGIKNIPMEENERRGVYTLK